MPLNAKLNHFGIDLSSGTPKEKRDKVFRALDIKEDKAGAPPAVPLTADQVAEEKNKKLSQKVRKLGLNVEFGNTLRDLPTTNLLTHEDFNFDESEDTGGKTGSECSPASDELNNKFFDSATKLTDRSSDDDILDRVRVEKFDCTLRAFIAEVGYANLKAFLDDLGATKEEFLTKLNKLEFQIKYPAINKDEEDMPWKKKAGMMAKNFIKTGRTQNSESENLGEYITANIYRNIAEKDLGTSVTYEQELAPRVYPVYYKDGSVGVASKYLKNSETLDDFITMDEKTSDKRKHLREGKKNGKGKLDKGKHVKIVDDVTQDCKKDKTDTLCYGIDGPNRKKLSKKGLANAIVDSAIFGDHDTNPGNVMVLKRKDASGNDYNAIVRIDFGHPFCDMLPGFKARIKGNKAKENYIIDYFNRGGTAGHSKFANQQTKLWRDYPFMVPSQEIVDALRERNDALNGYQAAIAKGIAESREGLGNLIDQLFRELQYVKNISPKTKESKKKQITLEKSILATTRAFTDIVAKFVDKDDASKIKFGDCDTAVKAKKIMDDALIQMKIFCDKNLVHMRDAADMMQLQVDIDNYLKGKNSENPDPNYKGKEVELFNLKLKYDALLEQKIRNLPPKTSNEDKEKARSEGIDWIKAEANSENAGFKGTLTEYMARRVAVLGDLVKDPVVVVPAVVVGAAVPSSDPHLEESHRKVLSYLNKELTNPAKTSKKEIDDFERNLTGEYKRIITKPVAGAAVVATAVFITPQDRELAKLSASIELARDIRKVNKEAEAQWISNNERSREPDHVGALGVRQLCMGYDKDGRMRFKILEIFPGSSMDNYNKKHKHNEIKIGDFILVPAIDEKQAIFRQRTEGIKKGGDITVERRDRDRFMDRITTSSRTREIQEDIVPAHMEKQADGKYRVHNYQSGALTPAIGAGMAIT